MKKPFLPTPNTSAHAKNQLSMSNSKGARPWTDRQTDKQTSVLRAATDRRPSKISRLKIELSVLADFKQTEKQVHVRCNRNHQSVPGQTQIQISKETFFILVLNVCHFLW